MKLLSMMMAGMIVAVVAMVTNNSIVYTLGFIILGYVGIQLERKRSV